MEPSVKGKLEKRIIQKQIYECDFDHMSFHYIIEEAKKEFPKYPTPLSEKDYDKDKWYNMLDDWDSKVQKWFKEWVGE